MEKHENSYQENLADYGGLEAVLARGLASYHRPRLTRVAREEINILQSCVQVSPLPDRTDQRFLDDLAHSPFTTQGAYRSLHLNDE